MSRVGKKPITIPSGVKVAVNKDLVTVEGPKGKLERSIHPRIAVEVKDGQICVNRSSDIRTDRALHGLTRSLIANMVEGVTNGFQKELTIVGVGYRAELQGETLKMQLRFSHPILYPIPKDITVEIPQPTQIIIKGIDRQQVGEVAAEIRGFAKPEPYKGKGIRYVDEYVRRKAGKAVA